MSKLVKKYQYELMFVIILLANLIYYLPVINELSDWTITPYALSYRMGFISRGFIGSIIRLMVPNLTIKHIYIIILINIFLLCGLTVLFMHKILVSTYDENRKGILILLFLFLVNPGSISFLFYWGNFGRFDMYLIMCLIISALFIIYDKCVWLIPFMCVCAVMTHQAFVFQYFPAVLILLFYVAFIEKRKYGKSIFIVTLLSTCAMFVYMQFFSEIKFTYEQTMAIIDTTTDLPADFIENDMMVKIEYYSSVFETFNVFVKEPLARNIVKSVTMILFIIPMIKIIADIWKCFCKAQKNRLVKLLPWAVLIAEVPMFVLTCDYGRDFSAIIISYFVLMFTLYAIGDKGIAEGIGILETKISNNIMYYVFVVVLCAAIGKFTAADIGDLGHRLYVLLQSLFY